MAEIIVGGTIESNVSSPSTPAVEVVDLTYIRNILSFEGELYPERNGTPQLWNGGRKYTRYFLIESFDKNVGPKTICLHPDLPKIGDAYESSNKAEKDDFALCYEKNAAQDGDDWNRWIVTVNYDSRIQVIRSLDDPTLEELEYSWEGATLTRSHDRDRKGRPYLNPAGQPYTPAPTFPDGYAVLTLSRTVKSINYHAIAAYTKSVNKYPFLDAPPGMVQVDSISAAPDRIGVGRYVRITMKLAFHPDIDADFDAQDAGRPFPIPLSPLPVSPTFVGPPAPTPSVPADPSYRKQTWQPEFLDAGLCRLQNKEGEPHYGQPVSIRRGDQQITQPVLLDKNGQELTPFFPIALGAVAGSAASVVVSKPITPGYTRYEHFKEMDFRYLLVGELVDAPGIRKTYIIPPPQGQ